MKPFFVLVAKIRIILLVGIEVKNKHTSGFWSILANIGNRTVKKEKGKIKEVAKGEGGGLSAGNGKGTTCSQRGLPPNQHCSPLSLSFSFSFSSKALFELQHRKEKKQLNKTAT